MRTLTRVAVCLCLAAPLAASASCFFIYGSQNRLLYRSTVPPVDLSRPISDGVRARFAGGHLVMIPDESACPDLLASGESQVFASIGITTSPARSAAGIETSPVLRNADSRTPYGAAGDAPVGSEARVPTRRDARPVPARGR